MDGNRFVGRNTPRERGEWFARIANGALNEVVRLHHGAQSAPCAHYVESTTQLLGKPKAEAREVRVRHAPGPHLGSRLIKRKCLF
jgi:hypothetical protein